MTRRRLPLGYYSDRGVADPITVDVDATIATGAAYLSIPIPANCQLLVQGLAWCIADTAAGGSAVVARTFLATVRRDSTGITAVTSPHALTATGAMTATPTEAVVAGGPTGQLLELSCAYAGATSARLRARFAVVAVPL